MNDRIRPRIRLLGELQVLHGEQVAELPGSRKTRALLAYLALNERRHRRDDLCELLWDTPSDPRAAVRWSLSKLRPLLDVGGHTALVSDRDTVAINGSAVDVDVIEIRKAMDGGPGEIGDDDLAEFERELASGYLGGLEGIGSVRFQLWLEHERNLVRDLHRCVIDELIARTPSSSAETLRLAGERVALDPLHTASNVDYLRLALRIGGLNEARQAFDRMRDHYASERQPAEDLVAGWRSIVHSTGMAVSATGDRPEMSDSPASDHEDSGILALPDRPSLAVLDFSDLGSHAEGSVLASGLAVDLNSRLAQLSNLFVIARASASRLSSQQLPTQEIGRKLGVRYLVSGTTQRQARRVRVTVTLLDATQDSEVWSEHFDRPLDDLFDIQDEITSAVIAAIEPAIERAEMQRALMLAPESLSAWESYHRGLWHSFRFTARDNELANRLFLQATSLDPRFSQAHAGISFTHYSRAFLNAVPDVDAEIGRALDAAHQSVGFDSRDAMGYWSLGRALFLSRQHDHALAAIDRALAINPNYAQGHYAKGLIGIHSGLDDASLPSLDNAQRLSPFDPLLFAMKSSRALSLVGQGKYDEAASWAIRATHEPNAHFHIYAVAAACLELAGRTADAQDNARWVLRRQPDYSVQVFRRSFPHKDEAHRAPFLAALERAGIPRG